VGTIYLNPLWAIFENPLWALFFKTSCGHF